MEIKRKPFQGVLNILSFNRHFYWGGLGVMALIILGHIIFKLPGVIFWFIIIAFLYGLLMPLIVSAYVYDFSGFYHFNWLKKCSIDYTNAKKILNINAGFDETSFIIKNNFPESDLRVFDFYNPSNHTEPAIIRARKVSLIYPNTEQIKSNYIPLEDDSIDIIFLLSAVHEIRMYEEKVQFLKECCRVCKQNGKVVMVEHLRDFPNFLAFSIGFTHFFSKSVWRKAFKDAGFSSFTEIKFTPFMSIFNCSQ
jgi:ubiquinone/menaquinone biosynthesis C-methylase UbiE